MQRDGFEVGFHEAAPSRVRPEPLANAARNRRSAALAVCMRKTVFGWSALQAASGHHAPAIRRPTRASSARMLRRDVVERQFFSGRDRAPGKKDHVPAHHATEAIRIARVVDVSRRVSAAASVDAAACVQLTNAHFPASCHASGSFPIADPLAQQLADLAPRRESPRGKAAFPVNADRPATKRAAFGSPLPLVIATRLSSTPCACHSRRPRSWYLPRSEDRKRTSPTGFGCAVVWYRARCICP